MEAKVKFTSKGMRDAVVERFKQKNGKAKARKLVVQLRASGPVVSVYGERQNVLIAVKELNFCRIEIEEFEAGVSAGMAGKDEIDIDREGGVA